MSVPFKKNALPTIAHFPATPLLRLRGLERSGIEVYAKAEWFNPSGSVKFRPALNIIEEGIRNKALTKKKTIIDASSGNTGAAYAVIGQAMGYEVELVMPRNVAEERKRVSMAADAIITFSDPLAGSDGAI
jgi:cysteine synthase B